MVWMKFQRAAVAILLMATLFAPFGTCRQTAHMAKHACCSTAPDHCAAVRADCCSVRTPAPAVVIVRDLPSPPPIQCHHEPGGLFQTATFYEVAAATIVGPHSPPPGASVLRI